MISPETHIEFATEPMSNLEAIKRVLVTFERHMDQKGWGDEVTANATFGVLHRVAGLTGEPDEEMINYGFTEIPVPEEFQVNPPVALQGLAEEAFAAQTSALVDPGTEEEPEHYQLVRELMDRWVRPDFQGFAISMEAYRINSSDPDAAEYTRENRIDEHPLRVEQRVVTGLAASERKFIFITRDRGDGDDEVKMNVVPVTGTNKLSLDGRVPGSLVKLTAAALMSLVRRGVGREND